MINNRLNRRKFVKTSALAGVGLTLSAQQIEFALAQTAARPAESQPTHLTMIALTDDCVWLAINSPGIAAPLKESLTKHTDVTHLGGLMPAGEGKIFELLSKGREGWAARTEKDQISTRLALAAGWLIQQAVRQELAPLYNSAKGEQDLIDCRVYQDVTLLREMSFSEQESRTAKHSFEITPAVKRVDAKEFDDFFQALGPRMQIRLHTFEPDEENIDIWLPRLFAWRKEQLETGQRYAEAYRTPDPNKVRRFITDSNFYDRTDALIRLARSLQRGNLSGTGEVQSALTSPHAQRCHYARSLEIAYQRLQAASDYFTRTINEPQLKMRLGIA